MYLKCSYYVTILYEIVTKPPCRQLPQRGEKTENLDWKKYGYVVSGDYRKKVVTSLFESPKTPKQIAVEINVYLSHVSKTLNELQRMDIAVCLTPELRRGRVYELTEDGKDIANYLRRQSIRKQ